MQICRFMLNVAIAMAYGLAAARAQAMNAPNEGHWVDVWTAMPQLTEYSNLPTGVYNNTPKFCNTTLRQTLKLDFPASFGSNQYLRLRISNAFGTTSLNITNATIARPANNTAGSSFIAPETLQTLTFDRGASYGVSIPDRSLAVTDPVAFPFSSDLNTYASTNGTTQSGSLITITLYLAEGQDGDENTSHPGSRIFSYLSLGNQVAATNISADPSAQTQLQEHWYFIATVEAWLPKTSWSVTVIGDSITDGRASTDNMNNRWPDILYSRLQQNYSGDPVLSQLTISNQGAGGNRVLADGNGPSAVSRVDRDILSHSAVKYAMIFEGVNDIGVAPADPASQLAIYDGLIAAYRQIISRVHAQGIPIFGCTITPFGNLNTTLQPYSDPNREATRRSVNNFIRTSGEFDGVVDFDAIVRDPANSTMLNPIYNSGDGLHPNVEGYMTMAREFPVELFSQLQGGVSGFL